MFNYVNIACYQLARLIRLIDENTEERHDEFKLQFLPIYTMKSWF